MAELRIVNPRDGWPNIHASRAASGADAIIDGAKLFDTVQEAVADCSLLFATTARAHDQAKPVLSPEAAVQEMAAEIAGEGRAAILFGRERWGLTNEEVALADRIVTFPVDPEFASLNLAQAVLLMGYEWFKVAKGGALPFAATDRSVRASKEQEQAFFDTLVAELDRVEFLRPAEKRDTMIVNLRNIFSRMEPTRQDMQTLHGAIKAIAEGAQGPRARRRAGQRRGDAAARAAGDHRRRPHAGRAGAGARACAAAEAKHVGRRARAVEVADEGPPLRRPVQAPDAGRPADPGFRVVSVIAWRSS